MAYDESSITVLKGLDQVRKRPVMYLGQRGNDMIFRMLKEPVDNCADEALVGRNDYIEVYIDSVNNVFAIKDCAEGIPVGIHAVEKISTLQVVMTVLHAGGKFNNKSYKFSCFVGSTKIRLLDGTVRTMKWLADNYYDRSFLVLSSTPEGVIVTGLAFCPRLTKEVSKLIKVTLDNGKTEKCTLDHKWMMRDGTYKKAQDLIIGDSLMNTVPYDTIRVAALCIIELEQPKPVYDISVDKYNNFLLDSGVFVHNSGTHGVGVAATNAVSSICKVWTWREGVCWHQEYRKGIPQFDVKKAKIDPSINDYFDNKSKRGTLIYYKPDQSIVSIDGKTVAKINRNRALGWLKNLALLNKGLKIVVNCDGKNFVFVNNVGPELLLQERERLTKCERLGKAFLYHDDKCTVAFAFSDYSNDDGILSFVSNSHTKHGGTHVKALTNVITKTLTKYALKNEKFANKDLLHGLIGVLNWRMSEPEFTSQIKDELDSDIGAELESLLSKPIFDYYDKHKKLARSIIKRAIAVTAGREQYKKVLKSISDVKKASKRSLLPNVLATAARAKPSARDLYLCEGDSAFGCHFANVLVLLVDGNTKTFEQLVIDYDSGISNVGLAYDIQTKQSVPFEFVEPRIVKYVTEYTELELEDGSIWRGTNSHPWLLVDGTYKAASLLTLDDAIKTHSAKMLIKGNKIKQSNKPIPVYDATSPKYHNLTLGNGCIVHNTCKKARDATYQEVLKLKGKPINAMRAKPEDVLANEVLQNVLIALDINIDEHKKGTTFSCDNLRVNNIYLLADADEDGPLRGDTRVLTPDGRNPTMEQLSMEYNIERKPIWVYSITSNGSLIITQAFEPKVYRVVQQHVVLTIDNGTQINCTLNHRWVIVTDIDDERAHNYCGNFYVSAQDLKVGDKIHSFHYEGGKDFCNTHLSIVVVKSVEIINCEPTAMYCLTEPHTGNFMVADDYGNGVCSSNCHINLLMIAFFFKFLPDIIHQGRLRVVKAPLFFGFFKNKRYIGSTFEACYSQMPQDAPKHTVIRAKGLGECDAEALAIVAFCPNTRSFNVLTYPETEAMLERYKSIVCKDTEARKELLGL